MKERGRRKKLKTNHEFMKRIGEMVVDLAKGRREVRPSKYWSRLMNINIEDLDRCGYKNFKRVLGRHYFANVPWWLMNRQILFLVTHLTPMTTMIALYKSLIMPVHDCFSRIDSASFNFITYLLWFYAKKVDGAGLLANFEEPVIGNPPVIKYKGKLISQDIANSVLEFKSIFDVNVGKKEVGVLAELGAGSGRDAYVFLKLLTNLKKYIIIDIPPALAVAERYLSEVFPEEKIFKFRPFDKFSQIREEFEESKILFFLPSQIEFLPDNSVDLFINISSFHEMLAEQIRYYFRQIERLTKPGRYFYFKQWKNSHNAPDDINIGIDDYPLFPKWKLVYLRTVKVQTKFFEALARLKEK